MRLRLAFALGLGLGLAAGCNAIAGISDYRTVDALDDAGAGGAHADGSTPDQGTPDAPLPSCSEPEVPLRITVVESKSKAFTGIIDQKGLFAFLAVGERFEQCVPKHETVLDLRAQPGDPSNAVHDWGACGTGSRCEMTVEGATILDVHLQ